jgi:hypothetical protein
VLTLRVLAIVTVAASIACGKKGPPLAPIVHVPVAAADFSARRVGDTVHLQFTIPVANTDGSRPADIRSVTIYGFTGTPLSNDDFVRRGTVVAQIPVRMPPPPMPENANVPPLPASGPGLDQGAIAVATEELTPELQQPILPKAPKRAEPPPEDPSDTVLALPLAGPPAQLPVARMYTAVGSNRRGQRGPLSPRISIPLLPAPVAPKAPTIEYNATSITVTWTAPPGTRQHVQIPTPFPPPAAPALPGTAAPPAPPAPPAPAAPAPPADPAAPAAPVPSRPLSLTSAASSYNVYEVPPPDENAAAVDAKPSAEKGPEPLAKPLNPAPLPALAFQDTRIQFGVERCYVVRTVDTFGTLIVESAPSERACKSLVDTFPPAAPKSLAAVASPGAISLIWEANTDADLAGYVVLRGEAPNETLQPLFTTPIRDTSFQDKAVKPGVQYIYAVIAFDNATPPNPSAQSNRVTETAR